MASVLEAPLSLKFVGESKHERRKREKEKAKKERKRRRERGERGYRQPADNQFELEAPPAQLAAGFLAWLDQQEIEGPESWRDEGASTNLQSRETTIHDSASGSQDAAARKLSRPVQMGSLAKAIPCLGSSFGSGCPTNAGPEDKRPAFCADIGICGGEISEQDASTLAALRVEAIDGREEQVVTLKRCPFTIGRSKRCDFVIEDPKVSSEHCVLFYQPESVTPFEIEDHSLSGVRVNGERLSRGIRTPLEDNARISLGRKGKHVFYFCVNMPRENEILRDALSESHVSVKCELLADESADYAEQERSIAAPDEAGDAHVVVSRRQELLIFLSKHSWLPPCAGDLCSMEELDHYSELLSRSLKKRKIAQHEVSQGRRLRSRSARAIDEKGEQLKSTAQHVAAVLDDDHSDRQDRNVQIEILSGAEAAASADTAGTIKGHNLLAWFEPLPRQKAAWGEPVLISVPVHKPWGVLPWCRALNLGDAMDVVLEALGANDMCKLARVCIDLRRLVAGSTVWRSLYFRVSRHRPGVPQQTFGRLQMPPESWKKIFVDLQQFSKKMKLFKRGKGAALSHVCLECPEIGCGKTFKQSTALEAHLRGDTNGMRRGPPHHSIAPDGRRHYCTHEFCPRYFTSARIAQQHTNSECSTGSTRCIARRAFGEGHFTCSECSATFRFQRAFNAHFITVNGDARCPTSKEAMDAVVVEYQEPGATATTALHNARSTVPGPMACGGLQICVSMAKDSQGADSSVILDLNKLKGLFDLTCEEAAKSLGLSRRTLMMACSKLGLERWPRRLHGFPAVEQELRFPFMALVKQFAASQTWPQMQAPYKGVYRKTGSTSKWYTKIVVMHRWVNLGMYNSLVEAALAFDACMLASGKPMNGRSGSYCRPAQVQDLNLLSPLDAEPSGVQVPTSLIEMARKLVDAHKREAMRTRLADGVVRGGWVQDLADYEVAKAKAKEANGPEALAPLWRQSRAIKRRFEARD